MSCPTPPAACAGWLTHAYSLSLYIHTDHEVAGSIPGTSTNFKCGLGLERGPHSLVRTIR